MTTSATIMAEICACLRLSPMGLLFCQERSPLKYLECTKNLAATNRGKSATEERTSPHTCQNACCCWRIGEESSCKHTFGGAAMPSCENRHGTCIRAGRGSDKVLWELYCACALRGSTFL